MLKTILRRLAVAILGVAVLTATTPSFAAMACCDHAKAAPMAQMQMSGMYMADMQMSDMKAMGDMAGMDGMTHQQGADQGNNMPCKVPASACVSTCAPAMAATVNIVAYPPSAVAGQLTPGGVEPLSGVARPPDLEPPILSA